MADFFTQVTAREDDRNIRAVLEYPLAQAEAIHFPGIRTSLKTIFIGQPGS